MSKKITIFVAIPLLLLFIANVFVSIGTSAKGAQIVDIERKIRQTEQENEQLTNKLVTHTALSGVPESAESLGLILPKQVIYLSADVPVAWKQD